MMTLTKQTLLDALRSVRARLDADFDGNTIALLNRAQDAIGQVDDAHFATLDMGAPAIIAEASVAEPELPPTPPLFAPNAKG
jgi:hypothetical protein